VSQTFHFGNSLPAGPFGEREGGHFLLAEVEPPANSGAGPPVSFFKELVVLARCALCLMVGPFCG